MRVLGHLHGVGRVDQRPRDDLDDRRRVTGHGYSAAAAGAAAGAGR